MIIFLFLFFISLVLDFSLQSQFMSEYKSKSDYVLFVHCAIWGLGIWFALIPFGLFAWWKLIMLVGGHFIIDRWKCRGHYKLWPKVKKQDPFGDGYIKVSLISDMGSFYIDQFLHIVQILLCL